MKHFRVRKEGGAFLPAPIEILQVRFCRTAVPNVMLFYVLAPSFVSLICMNVTVHFLVLRAYPHMIQVT